MHVHPIDDVSPNFAKNSFSWCWSKDGNVWRYMM